MATKPTLSNAAWGTDTNFSSGPASGTPVKVSASAGVKAQGWRPGDALGFVGAWFNYWQNQIYLWATYLDDLHNSADFLNKDYSFTGNHTHANLVQANGGLAVGSGQNISFDGAGEVNYDAARSFVLKRSFNGLGRSSANHFFGKHPSTAGAKYMEVTSGGSDLSWNEPIDLPQGAVITAWRALVTNDENSITLTLSGRLFKYADNYGTPIEGSPTAIGAADTTAVANARDVLAISGLSETVDNATTRYQLELSSTITPGGSAARVALHSFEITYEMPGLRQAGG